ncbi:MAG TPA: acetylornithine deacetylase, partial [Acidimicrobiia bacterium]|nr:acetylornithine deacetylase [Acidimicrobiia bacterium]
MLILGDLIGFPTVTSDSNLDLIAYCDARLRAAGAATTVTRHPSEEKANLLATIGPAVDGGVVLSGHTDVVPADEEAWTGAPFVAMRREQRIYGRGAVDMKGFIACVLAMAPRFAAADLRRPVHVALTFDEEVGCRGAPILVSDLLRTGPMPAAAIVGEPTEMAIIDAHKGCYEYTTTIAGLAGHGSAPAAGVNAVQMGARFVTRLMELGRLLESRAPVDSPYDPPQTTINVGTMNGGTARNVVAGECIVEWEMRPVRRSDADLVLAGVQAVEEELRAEMRSVHPGAGIVTHTEGAVDGLEKDPDSAAVRLARALLGDRPTSVVAFGTEAGIFQAAGIPAVVCGPGSIETAHRPD